MEFDHDLFVRQPWDVVRNILTHLPEEYIYGCLGKVPELRVEIAKEYYSNVDFILHSPIGRDSYGDPDRDPDSLKVRYIDQEDFLVGITSFIDHNSDIVPTKACISTIVLVDLEKIMTKYREYFLKVPNLEVRFSEWAISCNKKCFDLLLSFPNLKALRLYSGPFEEPPDCSPVAQFLGLDSFDFVSGNQQDKFKVYVPPNIKLLDITRSDMHSLEIPSSVEEICWRKFYDPTDFTRIPFPESLSVLTLDDLLMNTGYFSGFPKTLRTLRIIHCNMHNIIWDDDGVKWPEGLEVLDLSHNSLDDWDISKLNPLPHGLRTLNLAHNIFTNLFELGELPSTLKTLDVSKSWLRLVGHDNERDKVLLYEFSEGLEVLKLSGCANLAEGTDVLSPGTRATFPSTLRELYVDSCPKLDLSMFLFPDSLQRLSLEGTDITSLQDYEKNPYYDDSTGAIQTVEWKSLANLGILNLSKNKISNLEGWAPPPNLVWVDLRHNYVYTEELPSFDGCELVS